MIVDDEMVMIWKCADVSYLKELSHRLPGGAEENYENIRFSSPPHPDRLWDPASLLSNG
jgi:hypothetical protein